MRLHRSLVTSALALALSVVIAGAGGAQPQLKPLDREPEVPYVPTHDMIVAEMLKVAKVGKNDVLYDLGSGDGRIPITAAKKFGTRGIGVDIDPARITEARANAVKAGVADKVTFKQQDLFETDIKEATVVTLYLLQRLNEKLKPKLMRDLKPGTRIVSHAFDMGDWPPEKTEEVAGARIFLWTIPAKK
jgi:SAM-dependent methyltransferase